jgi:outer membrane protein TolC
MNEKSIIRNRKSIPIFLVALLISSCTGALADSDSSHGVLTLSAYISQVQGKNLTAQGSNEQKEGAKGRSREADLIFSPSLFANAQLENDKKLPTIPVPGFDYNFEDTRNYSLGISDTTSFGLQAKLYYALDYTDYDFPGMPTYFYDARPVIELTQSLWQNGFGRSDRANEEATRAQAESDGWNAQSTRDTLIVNAETAYWKLAIDRELVKIQERALEQSKAIYDYNVHKANMNLVDRADELQSKASYESKKLDLKSAQDDMEAATIAFNSYRNANNESSSSVPAVSEELISVDWAKLQVETSSSTTGMRADVKASEASTRASVANAKIQAEKDKPVFNVYADYALNGRDTSLSPSLSNSFDSGRPTLTVGLKLTIPLNFGATSDAQKGAELNAAGADHMYQQKLRDQESDYQTLIKNLANARQRLALSVTIEEAQLQKLEYEKKRLKQGRTTTYQVLEFEQDYTAAEYTRTNAASQVLNYAAQLKLYTVTGTSGFPGSAVVTTPVSATDLNGHQKVVGNL